MKPAAVKAFLALWNGISHAGLQPEYETWHTFEHVPERVGLPGFVEARRYRSVHQPTGMLPPDFNSAPTYFTWYGLTACEALSSPQYLDVVAHPTPWSARMRVELRDFVRLPCNLAGTCGNTSGAYLATLQLRPQSSACMDLLAQLLQQQVGAAQLVRADWGVVQPSDGFALTGAVQHTDPDAAPKPAPRDIVVMLQHLDMNTLRDSVQSLLQQVASEAFKLAEPAFFELLSAIRQDDLDAPLTGRQPARPELFKKFPPADSGN